MAMRRSAEKTDVKVNLWVTTGDGRNRSTRFKRLSFCKSNLRMLPPPLLLYCGSALRLWIFHGKHLTPCPERYFKVFFFLIETLGLESVTEAWSQSVAPRQRIGFMMRRLTTSGGYFHSWAESPLCPPRLINHWAVHSLLSLLKRSVLSVAFCWVEKWFQSARVQAVFWQTVTGFPVWSVWSWND